MLVQVGLYWRTLRHLRPAQWVGRARLIMPRRPAMAFAIAPEQRRASGPWREPVALPHFMTGPTEFRFIGHDGALPKKGGWDDPAVEKLWRYNLHYLSDLTADGWAGRTDWHRALLVRWIAENPVGIGTAWEPYPTSLRIVNWIKREMAAVFLDDVALASLATQARALAGRLEQHLFGNHLFANAKALICAGAFFAGAEAERWLRIGIGIMDRELSEQVLPDGGNFELSPMYHAIFTEDLLDLLNVAARWPGVLPSAVIGRLRDTASRMLDWASAMTFPDGEIALFNDAAIGIAPNYGDLSSYAGRLGMNETGSRGTRYLRDSGYIRAESGDATLIADVARIGPDYLPGHAHADTLSFEFALGDRRIVVNGGTSRYGIGMRRTFERSTAAHSTVEVAGQSSSEMWSGFRVGNRARPFDVLFSEHDAAVTVAASHDGYTRLSGKPIHRRVWTLTDAGLTIVDTVAPAAPAVARFILSPDVTVAASGDGWRVAAADRILTMTVVEGVGRLAGATHAPRFGEPLKTLALEVTLADGRSRIDFAWGTA